MNALCRALLVFTLTLATSACGQETAPPTDSSGGASNVAGILFAYFDGNNVVPERSRGVMPCEAQGPGTTCQFVDGQYEIVFERDVTACTFAAIGASNRFRTLTAFPRGGKPNGVFVTAFNEDGVLAATPFYLTVNC